jgi:hypothetical protein
VIHNPAQNGQGEGITSTPAEREANEALWAQRVAENPASGLSQPQWAAAQGVPWRRLKYWLHKFRTDAAADSAPTWVACAVPNFSADDVDDTTSLDGTTARVSAIPASSDCLKNTTL